jgi:hypothetical protein
VVNKIVLVLLALCASAHADDDTNWFGFRIGIGALPIDRQLTSTISLGLGVEHPVFDHWRVFGDYEWLWLERAQMNEHGDGQRIHVGLRRTIADKRAWHVLRLFVDGELGGGFTLANDNVSGVHALPDALTGVRLGYDMEGAQRSEAKALEMEVVVRAIAIPGGIGMMAGLGGLWR